jgi:hypothetical protein
VNEPPLASFLSFCLGLVLGHRLTLWRDRRKEFNEVALRIRTGMKARLADLRPFHAKLEADDIELFVHLLGWRKRRGFEKAWANYELKCKDLGRTGLGDVYYKDTDTLADAIRKVLPYTSLR